MADMGEQPNQDRRFQAHRQPHTAWVRPPDWPDMAPVSQLAIAYPFLGAMWLVVMMSASPTYEFLGSLLFLMIGPIFAMGLAVALGLPLRLNHRLSLWWVGNWATYIVLAVAGALLLVWGYNKPERQVGEIDGFTYDVVLPDAGLLMSGCLLLTFLAVNAGFPRRSKRVPPTPRKFRGAQ